MSSISALAAARAAWRTHAAACAAAGAPRSLGLSRRFASASGSSPPPEQQPQQASEAAAPQQAAAGTTAPASTSTSTSSADDVDADGFRLVYQGFFARPHKRLKIASLLNTFACFASAPLILSYSSASPVARVAVTTSVLAFALLTTGALHWFTAPYVHAARYCAERDELRVSSLRLLGRLRVATFPVSEVALAAGYHPLASFTARGRTYYVDRANFRDIALLERLVPGSAAEAAQAAAEKKQQEQEQQEGAGEGAQQQRAQQQQR